MATSPKNSAITCMTNEEELLQKLTELLHRLDKLEAQAEETREIHDNIKSIAKVFTLIEKLCVALVKLGAVVGGAYAAYKFILADIAGKVSK